MLFERFELKVQCSMAFPEIFRSRTDFEELEIQEFSNSMNHVLKFQVNLQKDQITTQKNASEKKKYMNKNQMTTTTRF